VAARLRTADTRSSSRFYTTSTDLTAVASSIARRRVSRYLGQQLKVNEIVRRDLPDVGLLGWWLASGCIAAK
jgi:hypothetical protein